MEMCEQRKLNIQMLPKSAWQTSLQKILPNWSEVSEKICSAHNTCQVCGNTGHLGAQEIWAFDDDTHTQSLKTVLCICDACHRSVTYKHSVILGRGKEALDHYAEVNGLTQDEAKDDLKRLSHLQEIRSRYEWRLDKEAVFQKIRELTGVDCHITASVNGRFYANIPYNEKDFAKKYGAKWDPDRKMWYFATEEERTRWDNRWR
ncbi:MAG: hypothetical protein IKM88_03225 [Lachnospiraceae bacterium]|nr:hypothetical protein [Lachnospiraceae bacterium]MBR3734477.1 hypothetical protein [Lachnospiraceae bacterium]MBR6849229.1 hypothetical protein [Lachnospiraceae bacterium]